MAGQKYSTVRNVSFRCRQAPTNITHKYGSIHWLKRGVLEQRICAGTIRPLSDGVQQSIYGWNRQSANRK
jgi:hypothetical protein